ncbi:hypothetical protein PO909_024934 [Leuciscus waleckii]
MDQLQECSLTMHLSSKLSDCSDDSNKSIGIPPLFSCDGNQTEEDILKWELKTYDELKRSTEELKSEFDRNHQTLLDKIKELDDAADELESMHKNTRVGSLVGSSFGAAGGIMSIAGVCLAPFILGASLALTGAGVVAVVAGGVTGAASNITNTVRQKTLREKIVKIINELQTTIKPMLKLLRNINNITEGIKLVEQTLKKHKNQRSARDGSENVFKILGVAGLAILGKTCAEAAKEIRVFVKAVYAVRGSASAARAVRATAEAVKEVRMVSAFTGVFAAAFLALDVYYIVKDSTELSEMNQPADKRKELEISSETLKFILQMKEIVDQFKKIVKKLIDAIDQDRSCPSLP